MNTRAGVLLAAMAAVALSGGCVASRQKHFQEVQQMVQDRTDYQVRWYEGRPEELFVSEHIQSLLDEPLSLRVAVQIALLNNPTLQSEYEQIGVYRGDLVQAGLLRNPTSWNRVRWPDVPPTKPDAEFNVSQDILDLFLLPIRKRISGMQLEQAKMRLGQTILSSIAEVRTAYYTVQAAERVQALWQEMLDITRVASERADQDQGFAPLTEVDVTSLQVTYRRAQIAWARAQAEVEVARAVLQRLMGIPMVPGWTVLSDLPSPPPMPDLDLADLEAMAMEKRLDLKATDFDLTTPAIQLARLKVLGSVFLIVDAEHTPSGGNLAGPALQFDVPLWNWNQGQIEALKAQGRQGSYNVLAYRLLVQYEVRSAYARLIHARRAVEMYREQMLPLQERLGRLAQQKRELPVLTDYLQVQQNQIDVRREYVELLRDYWIARSEMERSVGTFIPAPGEPSPQPEAATTEPATTATQPAAPPPDQPAELVP